MLVCWLKLKCKICKKLTKIEENEMCQAKDVESGGLKFLLKGRGHHPAVLGLQVKYFHAASDLQ